MGTNIKSSFTNKAHKYLHVPNDDVLKSVSELSCLHLTVMAIVKITYYYYEFYLSIRDKHPHLDNHPLVVSGAFFICFW